MLTRSGRRQSSRSLRKRTVSNTLLKQDTHYGSGVKKRKPDKIKHEGANEVTPKPPKLDVDILVHIMSFLGPRELFNVAFSCKALMQHVTVPMVVKASVEGKALNRMFRLNTLMSKKSIYVPSPLRLLRLANGKRCEFCNEAPTTKMYGGYGLLVCWYCMTKKRKFYYTKSCKPPKDDKGPLTAAWDTEWVRFKRNPFFQTIFQHPRVCCNYFERENRRNPNRIRKKSLYYLWREPLVSSSKEKIGPIVSFQDIDSIAAGCGTIEDYLATKLHAPSLQAYAEFQTNFRIAKKRAILLSKYRQHEEGKRRMSLEKKREDRKTKVKTFCAAVAAKMNEPWGESALLHERYKTAKRGHAFVKFRSPIVNDIMEPYVTAPSKMTWSAVVNVAARINQAFLPLAESGFLMFDFLSDEDDFELALKLHLKTTYPDLSALMRAIEVDDLFFEGLISGKLLETTVERVEHSDLGCLLIQENEATPQYLRDLASTLWSFKLRDQLKGEKRYHKAYAASRAVWREARAAIEEFYVWLSDDVPIEECSALSDVCNNYGSLEFLLQRDFDAICRSIFDLGLRQGDYYDELDLWDNDEGSEDGQNF